MKNSYIIGVDIGGTNTDAVLIDQDQNIISYVKTPTTEEVSQGFTLALDQLLKQTHVSKEDIEGIFLGTTQATNAILEKKDLFRVGVIRIAGQKPETLPIAFAWPQSLRKYIIKGYETIDGGFECYGGSLTSFCENQARLAIQRLIDKQVESIAIIGVFSPLSGEQERTVANLLREIAGESFPFSLSHEIGGIGFIERENSTILNASLKRVMQKGFATLQTACKRLDLFCPLMITQNDGSLIEIEKAINYPVLTISAGPTNSFIGGSRLSCLDNAVIVDIGGTSTDIGLVRQGFPMRSLNQSDIGGVSLNFSMPDVLSIALGGGSIIDFRSNEPLIGPISVGKSLKTKALSFGGDTLTLTDAALAMGYLKINNPQTTQNWVNDNQGKAIFDKVKTSLKEGILKMRGKQTDLPVIFVGGGAALLSKDLLEGNGEVPPFFNVANAYGAALAEISGTVDTIVSLQNRQEALLQICEAAKQKAIDQGADPKTLRLVDEQIIPYSYIPNQMARVIIRYSGKRKTLLH